MKNQLFFIALRLICYSLFMFGIAEAIRFDAVYPMEEGYFGEISLTEIGQEVILFLMFGFYLFLGKKWKELQPVSYVVSLFFLICFFREFNFVTKYWSVPSTLALIAIFWILYRQRKSMVDSISRFFKQPASSWLFSGFLVTFIFSRLFGRSKFWKVLYDENHYRLAKAVAEEGIELLGNTLMLIAAIEFFIAYLRYGKKDIR